MENPPPLFDPKPSPGRTFMEGKPLTLEKSDSWPESKHRFSRDSVWAIRSAIAARRPLLLRGEPGIGKSQLARAAAEVLRVPFLFHVVNERSERDELLYTYDAVARLALAQIGQVAFKDAEELKAKLAETNFICPGALWWAYDWDQAKGQANLFQQHCRACFVPPKTEDWDPLDPDNPCGPVVLIDEIDKADPSVPNGLLESLGNEGFTTPLLGTSVHLPAGAKTPLVIITTNEDRELPAAFLRRCLVLQMKFPDENESAAVEEFLIRDRARVFWPESEVSEHVCKTAISQLLKDRADARGEGLPEPGAAEFLDLLRILVTFGPEAEQLSALKEVHPFLFRKNLEKKLR